MICVNKRKSNGFESNKVGHLNLNPRCTQTWITRCESLKFARWIAKEGLQGKRRNKHPLGR